MKKFIRQFLSVFAFAAVFVAAETGADAANTINDIENGIYIGDVDVSGMTTLEAEQAVNDYIASMADEQITLDAMNDNRITVTAGELGLKWANPGVVDEAGEVGKAGNIIQRYKTLKDLEHENLVFPLELSVDEEAIRSLVEDDCSAFNVEAVDATMTRENGEFVITPGQTGIIIDVDSSVSMIQDYLTADWNGEAAELELVVEEDQPRGTEEELSQVKDVLGTYTTSYSSSGSSRSGNIKNGCSLIDGTLLYPGDEFSTLEHITPFTEANGYFMAGSYNNGMVVDSLGGGICQVSTTLYNAVLRAELEVTQRQNHSMIVNYVDPSCDAAIAESSAKDFKFVNSLDHPVYIEGYTTSDKRITFTVYGVENRPTNRKVSFESEVLETINPEGEKIIADGGQPAGYVNVQSSHTGYKAQLWKIVTVNGVEESREVINSSRYAAVPRTATVGTASADPNVTAAINAAIATGSIDQVRAVAAGATADPNAAAAAAAQAAQQAAIAQQQAAAQAAAEAAAQAAANAAAQ